MMAQQPWTGWSKTRARYYYSSAATTCHWKGMANNFPEHRINIIDTPATLTSQSKLNVPCVYWTALAWFTVQSAAFSHNLKQFGVKLTSTKFHVWHSSTRWTVLARTSSKCTIKCVRTLESEQSRSNPNRRRRKTSWAWLTW